jgi:hypothetical protein
MNREGEKPTTLPTEPGAPTHPIAPPTKPPGTPGQLPTLPTLPGTPEYPSVLPPEARPPEAGNLPSDPGSRPGGRTISRLPDTEERQDARQAERQAERIAKDAADLRKTIAENWEAVLEILPRSAAGMPHPEIVATCEKEGIRLKDFELQAILDTLVNALRAAKTIIQDVLGYRRID